MRFDGLDRLEFPAGVGRRHRLYGVQRCLVCDEREGMALNATLDIGIAVEHLAAKTEDSREAMQAFAEKRKPKFTGR